MTSGNPGEVVLLGLVVDLPTAEWEIGPSFFLLGAPAPVPAQAVVRACARPSASFWVTIPQSTYRPSARTASDTLHETTMEGGSRSVCLLALVLGGCPLASTGWLTDKGYCFSRSICVVFGLGWVVGEMRCVLHSQMNMDNSWVRDTCMGMIDDCTWSVGTLLLNTPVPQVGE